MVSPFRKSLLPLRRLSCLLSAESASAIDISTQYRTKYMPIRPVDLKQATGGATSIYEAIVIMSRRARQINDELKDNLSRRLETVASHTDDEGDITNFDQLEISREFD